MIDGELARARRCLEVHGASIETRPPNSDGHSSIVIGFPEVAGEVADLPNVAAQARR